MARQAPARRVRLAPADGTDENALTHASMLLPTVLGAQPVRLGAEVRAGDLPLVVTAIEPAEASTADPKKTEFELSPEPFEASPTKRRLVFDVVAIVDASWSMGKTRSDRPAPFALVRPALDAFLRQAGDVVRHASLVTFSGEPVLEQGFVPVAALDGRLLDRVKPRGRTVLAPALDYAAAALLTDAEPQNRHTIILFTDDSEGDGRLPDYAARAARLGINVHVIDVGDAPSDNLRALARKTRGVYAWMPDRVSLGPVFQTMARDIDAPFEWQEPATGDDDTEFEVVLRKSISNKEA